MSILQIINFEHIVEEVFTRLNLHVSILSYANLC